MRFAGGVLTTRGGFTIAGLVLAWCALWRSISVANLLSGLVVAVVAVGVVGGRGRGGVRVVPLARFAWLVAVDLVVSTALVVRDVLTPTDHTDEAIVAIELPPGARQHLLLLYAAITVTPGTAVVAAERDGSVLFVHVLYVERRRAVETHVHRLAQLATAALPVPDAPLEVHR